MKTHRELFGTEQPPFPTQSFLQTPWSFSYENGALRHIKINGDEAIRAIAFLARDRDWGTLSPVIENEEILQTDTGLSISYDAIFNNQDACLDVRITIMVTSNCLTMKAKGRASGAFKTNRTGFTVLHPICDVAGHSVTVDHSDGTREKTKFPDFIEPWQPFLDITALTHRVGELSVICQFQGDTFEMEDQRQWGDASFKTYNRPLAKPWPYQIDDRSVLEQSVCLTWSACENAPPVLKQPIILGANFPEMALVITPEDAERLASSPSDLEGVKPQRLLCHFDELLGHTLAQFQAFAKAQAACPEISFDLELICKCDPDPQLQLYALAAEMQVAGFNPASVLICPSVDRQSTPPGSDWPDCPPLDRVHEAAALAFVGFIRGGGMVSFFPELNRKRPPVHMLDFVSHGLCPIVHAADDISVMETLETIPHITRSMRAIIGETPYRIGPATLAMRQNPYGERTIPNPHNQRICMTDDDPRHHGDFAAAYAIGLATALAPAEISVWTPAALYGVRGVVACEGHLPIAVALKCLALLAGQPVIAAQCSGGLAQLYVEKTQLTANLTSDKIGTLGPFEWRLENRGG
jgi:D-apionolactonase